jgi:hypothetical protein
MAWYLGIGTTVYLKMIMLKINAVEPYGFILLQLIKESISGKDEVCYLYLNTVFSLFIVNFPTTDVS